MHHLALEENQRGANQAGTAKKPETIEEAQKHSPLSEDAGELRLGVERCVGSGETARREIVCYRSKGLAVALIEGSGVSGENGLVMPRAARQHRGDKRNPETAAPDCGKDW